MLQVRRRHSVAHPSVVAFGTQSGTVCNEKLGMGGILNEVITNRQIQSCLKGSIWDLLAAEDNAGGRWRGLQRRAWIGISLAHEPVEGVATDGAHRACCRERRPHEGRGE